MTLKQLKEKVMNEYSKVLLLQKKSEGTRWWIYEGMLRAYNNVLKMIEEVVEK